jgi:hypothetical protein
MATEIRAPGHNKGIDQADPQTIDHHPVTPRTVPVPVPQPNNDKNPKPDSPKPKPSPRPSGDGGDKGGGGGGTDGGYPLDPMPHGPALGKGWRITRHSHEYGSFELFPYTVRASWERGCNNQDWGHISVTVAIPFDDMLAASPLLPEPGDWLTVSNEGVCVAWGNVVSAPKPGLSSQESGGDESIEITITAESWLSFLARSQIFVGAGVTASIGTLYTLKDWSARLMAFSTIVEGKLGSLLTELLRTLVIMRLPPSLNTCQIGQGVKVIHDEGSCFDAFKKPYAIDAVKGWKLPSADQFYPSGADLVGLLTGTFVPDTSFVEFFEDIVPLEHINNPTALGRALGAQPILVYRIRPWREESVESFVSSSPDDPGFSLKEYSKSTWNQAYDFVASSVHDIPETDRNDGERVNAVTVGLPNQPDTPLRFWDKAGLPLVDKLDVSRHGFRLKQVQWPFFPVSDKTNQMTLIGGMRLIATLSAMMFMRQERFGSGNLDLDWMWWIRPGYAFSVTNKNVPRIPVFSAYAEHVTQTIEVVDTAITGSTRIRFSRALWGDRKAKHQGIEMPKVVIDKSTTEATPEAAKTPAPSAVKLACSEGVRLFHFPSKMTEVVESKIPDGLLHWALNRKWDKSILEHRTDSLRMNAKVAAACARVIEYYWQSIDSSARVTVTTNYRAPSSIDPNLNHSSGAGFDYTVFVGGSPIGVLQNWASMYWLADAMRIPNGGRGLYLNISANGIKGIKPSQAGSASRELVPGPYPLGGSGGSHYDFRNAFGRHPPVGPSPYFALDTNGDGRDDLEMAASDENHLTLAQAVAACNAKLRGQLPTVYEYYQREGGIKYGGLTGYGTRDPAMHPVSKLVPNVMQVLGQQPFCDGQDRNDV